MVNTILKLTGVGNSLIIDDVNNKGGSYVELTPKAISKISVGGAKGEQGERGYQGFQGAKGDSIAGPQGPQGSQGHQGSKGDQGTQGSQGSQGTQGQQGSTGAQGTKGDQGAIGNQGSQGSQGKAGTNGTQGAQGAQGAQGKQGASSTVTLYNVAGSIQATSDSNNFRWIVNFITAKNWTGQNGQGNSQALFDWLMACFSTGTFMGASGNVRPQGVTSGTIYPVLYAVLAPTSLPATINNTKIQLHYIDSSNAIRYNELGFSQIAPYLTGKEL